MDGTTLALIQAGAMISTFTYVFSRGLGIRAGDLQYFSQRRWLLIKSLVTVDVLVPLIAIAIILAVRPPANVIIGLLLLAASPASPLVLKSISKANGNDQYAVSLQVLLALLSIVTTPAILEFLEILTGFQLGISLRAVAELVGISILLPIVAGIAIAGLFPALARRIALPLEVVSDVVFLTTAALLLVNTYQLLLAMDVLSYVAIALMIAGALAAGHLLAGGHRGEQATLALESATRNTGLALLIAASFTTLENALVVLIPYIVTAAIISAIYVRYHERALYQPAAEGQD